MSRKTVLVTGANSGMGLAAATELARRGYRVVMACRSLERGEAARRVAIRQSGAADIELMLCDLGSLRGVRQFAEQFLARHDALDVLINNAGVITIKRHTTSDNFEAMMGVNHLGHFLLTSLLLPAIQRSPQGRIVVVSSGAHKAGRIHFEDPHLTRGFNAVKGYAQSKLANVLFVRELAERLRGGGGTVTVNAVHPGAVATDFGVDRRTGFGRSVYRLLRPFFRTPAEGAATAVYLATANEVAGVTGQYFYDNKPAPVSALAQDAVTAKRLWEWSEREVGL
ncbi:SDR family oxidoreductase [Paenibacillus mesophilus]|uniref:SDR family oxidoreductase n=1 Tax=Paenibacillus mesophilus TaxID=2582849 RepID=UPI00110D979A|nr:SDR family oxidoreductase [Paenibacillus mesophilus]TMV49494.1 SDR family oxidoreductase [Paenibacillus mesophilus]